MAEAALFGLLPALRRRRRCSPAGPASPTAAAPAGSTSPRFNVGDGPAAFLTMIVGALVVDPGGVAATGGRSRRGGSTSLLWAPLTALAVDASACALAKAALLAVRVPQPRRRGGASASHDRAACRILRRRWSSLAAVATMIALGVWQLRRAEWKADLLARYAQAQAMSSNVPWPRDRGRARARAVPLEPVRLRSACSASARPRRPAPPARAASRRSPAARSTAAARPKSRSAGRGRPSRSRWDGGRGQRRHRPGGHVRRHAARRATAPGLEPLAPPDPATCRTTTCLRRPVVLLRADRAGDLRRCALRGAAGRRRG